MKGSLSRLAAKAVHVRARRASLLSTDSCAHLLGRDVLGNELGLVEATRLRGLRGTCEAELGAVVDKAEGEGVVITNKRA